MGNKKWKHTNFSEALKYSLQGIKYALKNEQNLKIQLIFAILAIALAIFLKLSFYEFALLFFVIGLVLFAEMLNTALEFLFDLYSEEYNEKIKCGKNIASGAVLITTITSILIGVVLFLPKIINMFK